MSDTDFDGPKRIFEGHETEVPPRVSPSRRGCRLNLPPLPSDGGTITKKEYDEWTR